MRKIHSGKVRDIFEYDWDDEEICVIASDRVSAFDEVIPGLEIKDKGKILTEISRNWAELIDLGGFIGDNYETAYTFFSDEQRNEIVRSGLDLERAQNQLRLEMVKIEAVVRGYITGSLWKAYHEDGLHEFCGIKLPEGLKESDRLPEPIFTPTTKAPVGQHDENLTFEEMVKVIEDSNMEYLPDYEYDAKGLAETIQEWSLRLYKDACVEAESRGIIIADTKFEFGLSEDGYLMVGDEILTPDSSRFWPCPEYEPGRPQKSLDKQIIRDFVKAEKAAGKTNITLPREIIERTRVAYQTILDALFPSIN